MTWQEYLTSGPHLEHTLEAKVLSRLQGRLLDFTVEEQDGELVLTGYTRSYHVKQLAQNEVMSLTSQPIGANNIAVDRMAVTNHRP